MVLVFKLVGLLGSRATRFSLCRDGGYDRRHSPRNVYLTVEKLGKNKKMQEIYQKTRNRQEGNKQTNKKARNRQEGNKHIRKQEIYKKDK